MSETTPQSPLDNSGTTTFTLEIIWPEKYGSMEVEWIEIESPTGHFVVGPGHCDTVSLISRGATLVYQMPNGMQGSIPADGGMVIIKNNKTQLVMFDN